MIKVLVVDDHPMVRRGVISILKEDPGIEVLGEAEDGAGAIAQARELAPDVVIMDLQMPGIGGLEATSVLHTEMPQTQVLVLTISEKEADLFAAIRNGAKGYILKNAPNEELLRAIYHIAEGGVIVSPDMATKLLTELTVATEAPPEPITGLSPREAEVLEKVSQGATNKEIAAALFISENTVKTHLRNIMDKLGAPSAER